MSGWPTFDDVVAFLREHGRSDMASVVVTMRVSESQSRQAAERSVKAFQELQMRYEPPPATPGWRSYQAKPESSD